MIIQCLLSAQFTLTSTTPISNWFVNFYMNIGGASLNSTGVSVVALAGLTFFLSDTSTATAIDYTKTNGYLTYQTFTISPAWSPTTQPLIPFSGLQFQLRLPSPVTTIYLLGYGTDSYDGTNYIYLTNVDYYVSYYGW